MTNKLIEQFLRRACLRRASEFTSLSSWKKGHGASYQQALKKNWHRQIAEELGWEMKALGEARSYEQCKDQASEFSSLISWQKGHSASYCQAYRNNWHRQIAEELGWQMQALGEARSYEQCLELASEFTSLGSWQKGHSASYYKAYKKNWHRQIAEELGWKMTALNRSYEQCKEQASEFTSLGYWSKGHSASYQQALKNNWQRQIAEELGWEIRRTKNDK